ncbi:MAG: hypothetical protein IT163_09930 [Bryobacterales bacterium]|nr:hypothetical protein [Bryobacterales bacterium]
MSSEAARELARTRWSKATKEEKAAEAVRLNSAKTKKQRSAIAKKAAAARWARKKSG